MHNEYNLFQIQTECSLGWYGDGCKSRCAGHCIENSPCNHVKGQCNSGCAAGWMGNQCNLRKHIIVFVSVEVLMK